MERGQIELILQGLASEHKVPVPKIQYCDYRERPNAETPRVCFWMVLHRGPTAPMSASADTGSRSSSGALTFGHAVTESDVVHEFTHYLLWRDGWRYPDNDAAHGPAFYYRLVDVATRYYGHMWKHRWRDEYPHLYAWADAEGLRWVDIP